MTTKTVEPSSTTSKRLGSSQRAAAVKTTFPQKRKLPTPIGASAKFDKTSPTTRDTKHARLLALLAQPEGASIEEMMRATDWQQHSIRGFLAGTVKRKLGLELRSSKPDGEDRRYRIVPRRGR